MNILGDTDTLKRRSRDWLEAHWLKAIVIQTLVLEAYITVPNFTFPGRPELMNDSMFFQYVGWLWVTTPQVPYLYIADIKPPAILELSVLVALLSGGDPYWMAALGSALMVGSVVGTLVLVGLLVYEHTGDVLASYLAASIPLGFPWYFQMAATGLRPKYFTVFLGLVGVFLALRRRWVGGAFAASLAAGFWQLGMIFPAIIVGLSMTDSAVEGRSALGRAVIGGLAAVVVVVGPIALAGVDALEAMVVQVFVGGTLTEAPATTVERAGKLARLLSAFFPIALIGALGSLYGLPSHRGRHDSEDDGDQPFVRRTWWIPLLVGWFVFGALRLDLNGRPDIYTLIIAVAIGFGLLVAASDESAVPILVVVSGLFVLGFSIRTFGGPYGYISPGTLGFELPRLQHLYWGQSVEHRCYARDSGLGKSFAREFGQRPNTKLCRYDFSEIIVRLLGR